MPLEKRNKYIKSYCSDCGKGLVGYKNKRCRSCYLKSPEVVHNLKFEDLKTDHTRRRWLLKEIGSKCQICGIEKWLDKPVPVVMDHMDGNPENNSRENLRLICRNCDGLLPTFSGRNKGSGRLARRLYRIKQKEKYAGLV